jgi:diguanylate cyclase
MTAATDLSPPGWMTSPEGHQRAHLHTTLLALAIYAVFAVVLQVEVSLAMIDQRDAATLIVFYMLGACGFVAVIGSGVNQRFHSDPGLLQAQCCFGVLVTCASYSIQGQNRGAVLSVVTQILVFGMFGLSVKQAVRVSVLSAVMLGTTMWWKAWVDPIVYLPTVEFMHFLLVGVVLVATAVLSIRVAGMRQHLHRRNAALSSALEQIQRLATRDDLTGLVNRRHMSELLTAEQVRHARTGHPTSLALIDIDLFKRVNDEHGHAAGDAVLKTFAETAAACLRASDVLARWGGEEFLLMLPATDAAPALRCVERIRERLAGVSFDHIQPGMKVTFSAGLSVLEAEDTVHMLVERADQAMYQAKRSGRNCSVRG